MVKRQKQPQRESCQGIEAAPADRPLPVLSHIEARRIVRTVRRSQLREIVPLSDTTIYEMEQRGEFPRRFNLTPAASFGTWEKSKRGFRNGGTRPLLVRSNWPRDQTCGRGRRDPSNGIEDDGRPGNRLQCGCVFIASRPRFNHVGPFLQHVAPLRFVFRLVIDAAGGATVFVGKAFFDPVAIESDLV